MTSTQQLLKHCQEILRLNLGAVYQYLDDPSVQEVMINHPKSIWVERAGVCEQVALELSADAITSAITNLANLNVKDTTELMDCRLPGLRIATTLPPIAPHGPSMCIRRHSARVFTLDDYVQSGAFAPHWPQSLQPQALVRPTDDTVAQGDAALAQFLRWVVQARHNIIVTGATSAGKTTLLNAIAACIDKSHRVGTIEDTAELQILVKNWFSFEANASFGVDIRALVRHALRYRPTRIIVGEVRGPEAFDMLDAYNTGHPGSMVSFHSDSAAMSLSRLENMVRMAPEAANWPLADLRRQIAATFRFVIHASVVEGHRGPQEVMEVIGVKDGQYQTRTLFRKS